MYYWVRYIDYTYLYYLHFLHIYILYIHYYIVDVKYKFETFFYTTQIYLDSKTEQSVLNILPKFLKIIKGLGSMERFI